MFCFFFFFFSLSLPSLTLSFSFFFRFAFGPPLSAPSLASGTDALGLMLRPFATPSITARALFWWLSSSVFTFNFRDLEDIAVSLSLLSSLSTIALLRWTFSGRAFRLRFGFSFPSWSAICRACTLRNSLRR
uniref:Uncharacterized protein n=1 Tax=Rhipicephalus microplus TaxID=6941 RepID=A0A6M2D983_RHIMP